MQVRGNLFTVSWMVHDQESEVNGCYWALGKAEAYMIFFKKYICLETSDPHLKNVPLLLALFDINHCYYNCYYYCYRVGVRTTRCLQF